MSVKRAVSLRVITAKTVIQAFIIILFNGASHRDETTAGAAMKSLENKTAIITGAGGGIGGAIADCFARE
ncbi:MAG TPA: hypothetical protein VGA09_07245, partial [Candidatus Binatia bacterium]